MFLPQLHFGQTFLNKDSIALEPCICISVFFLTLLKRTQSVEEIFLMKVAGLLWQFISVCEQILLYFLFLIFFFSLSTHPIICFQFCVSHLFTWVGITCVWLTELMGKAVNGTLITDSDVNTPILPFQFSYIPLPLWHSIPLILRFVFYVHFFLVDCDSFNVTSLFS